MQLAGKALLSHTQNQDSGGAGHGFWHFKGVAREIRRAYYCLFGASKGATVLFEAEAWLGVERLSFSC